MSFLPTDGVYIDPQTGKMIKDLKPIPDDPIESEEPEETPSEAPTTAPTGTPSTTPVNTPSAPVATTPANTVTPAAIASSPSITTLKVNATFTSGNFKYKVTKAATAKTKGTVKLIGLTKKGAQAKKLNVPASTKAQSTGYKVTAIGTKAFKGSKAASIALNKNIKTIPSAAFANCKKLKSLTVKAKLKKVAKNAFKGCKKKITIKGSSSKIRKANVKRLKKSGYKKFK